MDQLAYHRIRLALKVLESCYGRPLNVTDAEIEALRSCLDGDRAGGKIDDVAVDVIHQELNRDQRARNHKKSA